MAVRGAHRHIETCGAYWQTVTGRRRQPEVDCFWILGEVAARRDPPEIEATESYYLRALALTEQLGMRPLHAHCHLDLGKLCRRVGRLDEARAELSTAVAMLREMGMVLWLPEAEAELSEAT